MSKPIIIDHEKSEKYGMRFTADSAAMLKLIGVTGPKLPKEAIEPRYIQGIRVWVEPHVPRYSKRDPSVELKTSKHRVLCECPNCGHVLSVGRLHQHLCNATRRRYAR